MKKLGRRHRPFYRVCAMDVHSPRDGRVLEELGTYDPMVPDVDARAVLSGERIDYWLSVGAQPSDKVKVLIKKYGSKGTHLQQQQVAMDRLAQARRRPEPPKSVASDTEESSLETPPEETVEAAPPEAAGESTPEQSSE
jgi:small subunit ribosomal protein S16